MKKLIALLMILAVVLTGVFAVPYDSQATVTLNGSIDGMFTHGPMFKDGNEIKSILTFDNVFKADGLNGVVEFDYGYKTNDGERLGHKFYMMVSDFESDDVDSTITFSEILIGGVSVLGTNPAASGYLIGAVTNTSGGLGRMTLKFQVAMNNPGGDSKDYRGNNIGARNVADAEAGEYTADIVFTVSAT